MKMRRRSFDAAVAQETHHLARLDPETRHEPARDRRQVEVLSEDAPTSMSEPNIEASVLLIRSALNAIDDAVMSRKNGLPPDLATDIDAAMARAALGRPIARAFSSKDATVVDRHSTDRTRK